MVAVQIITSDRGTAWHHTGQDQTGHLMPVDAYNEVKQALLELGGHRVWSLMVTLFGDLAPNAGENLEGPVLSSIMAEMDIRPEAVRVALHRLRNDGWITSEKRGRTGRHALTEPSRNETARASARIYGQHVPDEYGWTLVLAKDDETASSLAQQGAVPLLPRVLLGHADQSLHPMTIVFEGTNAPEWLRSEVAPIALETEYATLLPFLQAAEDLISPHALTPLQITVLRCLVVHNWRRIVLRHPELPASLLPPAWSGHTCRKLVSRLLQRFPRTAASMIP